VLPLGLPFPIGLSMTVPKHRSRMPRLSPRRTVYRSVPKTMSGLSLAHDSKSHPHRRSAIRIRLWPQIAKT